MNSQSIKKLRRKFVLIAMASIAAVVIFISGFINVANLISTRRQIREVLNYICDNDGAIWMTLQIFYTSLNGLRE